jgi:hypothetical protein
MARKGKPRAAKTAVRLKKPHGSQRKAPKRAVTLKEAKPSVTDIVPSVAQHHIPKWIEVLEKELQLEEYATIKATAQQKARIAELSCELAENLWHLWLRFNKLGATMTVQPDPHSFLSFTLFPEQYALKTDFDFSSHDTYALVDTTPEGGHAGDSLIANFYTGEGGLRFRLIFEFVEGERYHRYAGWKRHISRYQLFDALFDRLPRDWLKRSIGDLAKAWYQSYLKGNRRFLLNYVRNNFKLAEQFIR